MQLEAVSALIAGAAGGMGRHLALELARSGASVAAGDIDVEGLSRLESEAAGLAGGVVTGRLDVTDEASVKQFATEMAERLGGINTLVYCAGVLLDGLLVKDEGDWVVRLPTAQWERVIGVNLTGAFWMGREVAASMLSRGAEAGCIVNVSSVFAAGNQGQTSYSASKAGLEAMTRTWALELAPHGVRVAAVAPGLIATPFLENIRGDSRDALLESIPLRRFGTVDEVWKAVKFVLECDYFTGRVLHVDGGIRP